jgi:hypothetical protein
MIRLVRALVACSGSFLLLGSAVAGAPEPAPLPPATEATLPAEPAVLVAPPPPKPEPPKPPTAEQALDHGVLIVVSIPAQRVFVFKDGAEWGSAPVSTGKRGHSTPTGVFPILQKSKAHRSTLYNDAPMPYMQRLTWGGVALHGGNVNRARASHGCIRLPHAFAKRLYKITSFRSTAVLVTRERVRSPETALALVGGRALPAKEPRVQLAAREAAPAAPADGPIETIQLAAAPSPQNAAALWDDLVERQPILARLDHRVIPAVVNSLQVYRLRATGPGAAAICRRVASEGVACFRVGR